eukprot:CAMPEP_0170196564 /NCGR_PEP_ID=MMETSP0040_2-20121228/64245_1 /TAXON_ID=641309 /ORGANISM="Lotharella oceanica, Strain CCMP622" /LENGTH=41 /DNA_ID= /DNA_START= /DNA_END= /DNA_ORIENTATION=
MKEYISFAPFDGDSNTVAQVVSELEHDVKDFLENNKKSKYM